MSSAPVQLQPEPAAPPSAADVQPLPPLQAGDRLTLPEFERRYHQMPPHVKAELIAGMVYMPSPVRARSHGRPHAIIMGWLMRYEAATPGTEVLDNATVRLGGDNEPQPDALLRIEDVSGGRSSISGDNYVEGAPELVVEIAASSAAYDLHDKRDAYRRAGVQEYLVWSVFEHRLMWFMLHEGRYVALPPDDQGVIHSQVFPGLSLAVAALLDDNLATVLAVLQKGIAGAAHTAFVQRLAPPPS